MISNPSMEISVHSNIFSLLLLLLLSLSFSPSACEACNAVDKEALLGFKSSITADPSQLLQSWISSSDCCSSWKGVACNSAGRVINVTRPGLASDSDFIEDTFMNGTLSPSLGNLSFLQILDLGNLKNLKGSIPPEFGKLTRLTLLFLDSNQLTGSIPVTFKHLSRLEKLYLSNNNISGIIPPSVIGSFKSLTELGLSGNQLGGSIPATIGKLAFLAKLDIHANNLSGSLPTTIGKLKSLKYLDLSENQITGSIPKSIGGLSVLVLLYLNENQITGSIPSSISGLISLQFCRISENKLTGNLPPSLGELPNIRRLILENNKLTGKLPATMGHLVSLTEIYLSNNHFTGKIPSSFGNLKNLQTLDLSRNHLSGKLPYLLVKLQNLQTLDLSFNPLGLISIPKWFAELKLFRLILAKTGIRGSLPRWLFSTSISTLDLSGNALTGKLPPWIGNMTSLSFLNLSNNGLHSSIPAEFKNLRRLMDLDLHSNKFSGHLDTIFSKETDDPLGHFNTIDLSDNMFTGPINESVVQSPAMNSITSLVLSYNPLKGSIPKSLGQLSELQILKLVSNGVSGKIPGELGDAMELTTILLSRNKLSGTIPGKVLNLKELHEFDVSDNRLSGKIPPHKAIISASAFIDNPGLCGAPLPPYKRSDELQLKIVLDVSSLESGILDPYTLSIILKIFGRSGKAISILKQSWVGLCLEITCISSFTSIHPLSSSSTPSLLPSSLQEMECVEAALKTSFRKEMALKSSPQAFFEDNGQNGVSCDDFSVDDLFDFSNEEGFLEQQHKEEGEAPVSSSPKRQKLNQEDHFSNDTTNFDYISLSTDELSVPADDVANLEWLSHFVEDSFSEQSTAYPTATITEKPKLPADNFPEPENPVTTTCFKTPVPAKARSKRTRTGGQVWSLVASPSLTESSSSSTSSTSSSSPSSPLFFCTNSVSGSTFELSEPLSVEKPPVKKHKKRPTTDSTSGNVTQLTRRCRHCGVTKTPQWRAGPMGPKTLCNACGVRFKSGRLLPEYRPACSPTFSSDLHSNHHRKVLEMRRKKETLDQAEPVLAPGVVPSFG
ncbi:hypothetical protein CRYUN_Cryun15aG0142000 [Craigia yunnanensis]